MRLLYIIKNDTKFHCDTNEIQVIVEGIDQKKSLVIIGQGMGIKPIDRSNIRFLIYSACATTNNPRLTIAYKKENGSQIVLKKIELNKYM